MVILELVVSVIVIVVAAQLFENGLENSTAQLGKRLQSGKTNVKRSSLDALGTVLPKSITTTAMVLSEALSIANARVSDEIGVGIIISAPLVLTTFAIPVVGASAIFYCNRRAAGKTLNVGGAALGRDTRFFLAVFGFGLVFGLLQLPSWSNYLGAAVLITAFLFHVMRAVKSAGLPEKEPLRLILWRSASEPPTWLMLLQFIAGLALLVKAVAFFLSAIEGISAALATPLVVVSLVLAPLATELPAKINLVKWVRDGKDVPAISSITSAIAFQSTIPVALGLLFTPWKLKGLPLLGAALSLVCGSILYLMVSHKKRIRGRYLLVGGAFYAVFLAAVVVTVTRGG